VLAHGVTAAPLANRYADWIERHPRTGRRAIEEPGGPDVRWRLHDDEAAGPQ